MRNSVDNSNPPVRSDSITDRYIILLTALFPPIGIYLIAKYRKDSQHLKKYIIFTSIYIAAIFVGILIADANISNQHPFTNSSQRTDLEKSILEESQK